MPLTLPNLDDRRWAELVDEGRALIPFYAPEWTDHNVHDPGITLLELFAWLAEMDVYHLNRVTDRNKLKFLSLVGIHLEPPHPSLAVLSLTPKPGTTPLILPAVEFDGVDLSGRIARFSTLSELTVNELDLELVLRETGNGIQDLTNRWKRGEAFAPFGDDPGPGSALYLGFKQPLPVNLPVTLFLVVRDLQESEAERLRIMNESVLDQDSCRRPNPCLTDEAPATVQDGASAPLSHHSARLVWEYFDNSQTWRALDSQSGQVTDETRALSLNGRVVIKVPEAIAATQVGQSESHYFLRCRLLAGVLDAPPRLLALVVNGVLVEQSASAGERREIQTPAGPLTLEFEDLGSGTGRPNQQFALAHPAALEPFRLFTLESGEWREWEHRADFDASRRGDAHFLVDASGGVVRFGDGEKGRAVPLGAKVIASYRSTRGEEGNLPADTVKRLADRTHNDAIPGFDLFSAKTQLDKITNPLPAVGGRDTESLDHAEGRAFEVVRTTPRAVTLEDCESLARETPGTQVARVAARANLHSSFPCLNAEGIVTVIILPYLPKGRPSPSSGLRRAVAAYLARRRVIGTRIEVVGPVYRAVSVRARVQSLAGTNRVELRDTLVARLNEFFDPLSGGPDGAGWVLGRDIYRSEVLQTIDETVGVDNVISLELIVDGKGHCGNVCLGPLELVSAGEHQIEVV